MRILSLFSISSSRGFKTCLFILIPLGIELKNSKQAREGGEEGKDQEGQTRVRQNWEKNERK